jgi:hypothetical protein
MTAGRLLIRLAPALGLPPAVPCVALRKAILNH